MKVKISSFHSTNLPSASGENTEADACEKFADAMNTEITKIIAQERLQYLNKHSPAEPQKLLDQIYQNEYKRNIMDRIAALGIKL